MTRIALCLRGSSALRVRLVPVGEAGADGKRVSGAGAHKAVLHQVDATQLELACAAVLNALSLGGVVCETDTLQHLDNTAQDVQGTPLERACLWRAALEALVSTGHVTRLGRWYTVRGASPRARFIFQSPHLTRAGRRSRAGSPLVLRADGGCRAERRAARLGDRGRAAVARAACGAAAAQRRARDAAHARAGPRAEDTAPARQDGAPSAAQSAQGA